MADASIEVYQDQFTNLANGHTATMLVLPISLGLTKNSTLTIYEIDALGVRTGLYGTGFVKAIAAGEFYNLPTGQNQYYLNPLNMFQWIDYSSTSTVVGWSSFTSKKIRYCVIGSTLFFSVAITGTSNATTATFTLPRNVSANMPIIIMPCRKLASGFANTVVGAYRSDPLSNVIQCFPDISSAAWANTGTKQVVITGFVEI